MNFIGGYPGKHEDDHLFDIIASEIRKYLDDYFPETYLSQNEGNRKSLKIIAEPGSYFVASAFTLCVNIIARRETSENNKKSYMYYLNAGLYTGFLELLFGTYIAYSPIVLNVIAYIKII